MLIMGTVFAVYQFTPNCETKTTASLLPTLVAEKGKLNSYNFETNEFVFESKQGTFQATNRVGCLINGN